MTLISSQNLCKYLYYNEDDPLSQPTIDDISILLFNNLYITPVVPTITDVAKSLITIVLDDFRLENIVLKNSKIVFNVLIHLDLWTMSGTGKLRPYSIMSEIDKLFNNQNLLGIGNLEFVNAKWIAANEKWHGYQISYKNRTLN